ncbi:MAG: signal peptidase II [Gammaproteobacteria bacterium]
MPEATKEEIVANNGLPWLWLGLIIILLDQATKCWVLSNISFDERIYVLPFFDLTLRYNTGAAFNFLAQAGAWAPWFLGTIALLVSLTIIFTLYRLPRDQRWVAIALSLILGGALGNLLDRFYHGYVIDFLLLYVGQWQWPAFNVADSSICIGAAMLIIAVLRKRV